MFASQNLRERALCGDLVSALRSLRDLRFVLWVAVGAEQPWKTIDVTRHDLEFGIPEPHDSEFPGPFEDGMKRSPNSTSKYLRPSLSFQYRYGNNKCY